MNRRDLLKGLVAAGLAAAPASAAAREAKKAPDDAVGLLVDSVRCIGCKACVVRCREVNGLPPSRDTIGAIYDAPPGLDGTTKNVIQLARDGDRSVFVKRQCMHCVDPACVSACMIGALQKGEKGIVTYDPDRCIGCRYCQAACPFDVPKFEWAEAAPKIVKCELCKELVAEGKTPGCADVCPRDAVTYGTLAELKAEAHRRIAAEPGKYLDHVYGETEGGGTQVLYLSALAFDRIGLPVLGPDGVPHVGETVQHGIYQGFIAPAALYACLGVVILRNRRKSGAPGAHEEEER